VRPARRGRCSQRHRKLAAQCIIARNHEGRRAINTLLGVGIRETLLAQLTHVGSAQLCAHIECGGSLVSTTLQRGCAIFGSESSLWVGCRFQNPKSAGGSFRRRFAGVQPSTLHQSTRSGRPHSEDVEGDSTREAERHDRSVDIHHWLNSWGHPVGMAHHQSQRTPDVGVSEPRTLLLSPIAKLILFSSSIGLLDYRDVPH
jgi:hypothetical protein